MERLLSHPVAAPLLQRYGRDAVKSALRSEIATRASGSAPALLEASRRRLEGAFQPEIARVVNATGVLIHTNLGRAPLSDRAAGAISAAARGYQAVEIDLASGRRGVRAARTRAMLATFLGAEGALIVNNNAAAVLLALSTVAKGGNVLVSRGELPAIGGSFKIPEILEASGARLREVGTTNRTKISDYARAYDRETTALLTVHPSNFEIRGYTDHPSFDEIARFARRRRLPWIHDLGSGNLIDLSPFGVSGEERLSHALRAGASIVTFSGDKLFGGPQAGILAGKRGWLRKCAAQPLARAVRPDKLTLAGLFATLCDWISAGPGALPLYALAATPVADLERRATAAAAQLPPGIAGEVVSTRSLFGGGTTPEKTFASAGLAVRANSLSPEDLSARLRAHRPPVVGRVEGGRLILDFRTIFPEEDGIVIEALREAAEPDRASPVP
jgi:L-seryl-tRNA(Ser) seleniumtransferase